MDRSNALTHLQMAKALRLAGAGGESADGPSATEPVPAGATRPARDRNPVRRLGATVTMAMLVVGTLVTVQATENPGDSADSGRLAPSASARGGSIPGTATVVGGRIQDRTASQEQSKMLSKLTGMAAATAVGVSATVAGAQSAAVQWRVEDGGNGHWYAMTAPSGNWHVSAAEAAMMGGHLATLTSASETVFAASVAQGEDVAYIGARQEQGSREPLAGWRWITGEPWGYESWHFNMDDAPCGGSASDGEQQFLWMHNAVHQWDDVNDIAFPGCPLAPRRGIVEWSADCNNDGIVDYGQCRDGSLPDFDGDNVPDCCEQGVACVAGIHPVEWRLADGGNGHWYFGVRFPAVTSWSDARAWAGARGGHLATAIDLSEADQLFRVAGSPLLWNSRFGPWLGGFQDRSVPDYAEPNRGWLWVTGEPWIENWGLGEPNNLDDREDHLHFITSFDGGIQARRWNDFDETGGGFIRSSIVEWSADCDSDGIVDYGQILRGERPDANANGVPDGCECIADLNDDGFVQGADLGLMLAAWGTATAGTAADVNRDGAVDGNDLGLLLAGWGPCAP